MTELSRQHCEACSGSTPRLATSEIDELRSSLDSDWQVEDERRLYRSLRFRDFNAAFTRATAIALVAESEGHHPDLSIGWGRLEISLTTHVIDGLSRNDFILAAKVDALAAR